MILGWLFLDESEVLNDSRLVANLQDVGMVGNVFFQNPSDPCPALAPLLVGPTHNPWYDDGAPESERFLGFWVEDAYMNATITRSVNSRGVVRGGANLGAVQRPQREIAFEVMLVGEDMAALRWGYDWLCAQFDPVNGCDTATAWVRTGCPDDDSDTSNLWELREVGILDPPEWGDAPLERGGCIMRPVTFTMVAGDPWRYSTETATVIDANTMPLDEDGCGSGDSTSTALDFMCPTLGLPDLRLTGDIEGPGLRGQTDAIVLIDGGTEGCAATLIRSGEGDEDPDFATITSTAVICRLAPGERVMLDSSRRRVYFDNGDNTWRDGSAKVASPPGEEPWIAFHDYDVGFIWIEPANLAGHSDTAEFTVTTRTKVGV